jgi:hypothetical protein
LQERHAILTIRDGSKLDTGPYRLLAENELGMDSAIIKIQISGMYSIGTARCSRNYVSIYVFVVHSTMLPVRLQSIKVIQVTSHSSVGLHIVAYLLKVRTGIVEPEKQPLLANGSETTFVSRQQPQDKQSFLGSHKHAHATTKQSLHGNN